MVSMCPTELAVIARPGGASQSIGRSRHKAMREFGMAIVTPIYRCAFLEPLLVVLQERQQKSVILGTHWYGLFGIYWKHMSFFHLLK